MVDELELGPSNDTLGRWMAHHIASLIQEAESASGDAKRSAENACFEAILKLWEHRAELPDGKRPFQEMEPIFRAVASLDPENSTPRYFRAVRPPRGEKAEKTETEMWLDTVEGLDYSAKVLIGYCLAAAADAAPDQASEWVKLARAASADDGVSELVIRFVSTAADLKKEDDLAGELRKRLEEKLKRLGGFAKLAETFEDHLRAQIGQLPQATENSTEDRIVYSSKPPLE